MRLPKVGDTVYVVPNEIWELEFMNLRFLRQTLNQLRHNSNKSVFTGKSFLVESMTRIIGSVEEDGTIDTELGSYDRGDWFFNFDAALAETKRRIATTKQERLNQCSVLDELAQFFDLPEN